ncbi:hypothetical protein M501DRAFT_1020931 [Patellaria atrata CBS 101060]|uniref:Mediator of RNA polymerase II transcription subunit 12 n=1 Tax=Patellaria atrata CBS 101060 TaxID=1346257 RepID=A0A9P4S2L2_9PEZI|nr:hypothetical protein M501DRAFT_1020931 [Patellaria atrata CBS 101060]
MTSRPAPGLPYVPQRTPSAGGRQSSRVRPSTTISNGTSARSQEHYIDLTLDGDDYPGPLLDSPAEFQSAHSTPSLPTVDSNLDSRDGVPIVKGHTYSQASRGKPKLQFAEYFEASTCQSWEDATQTSYPVKPHVFLHSSNVQLAHPSRPLFQPQYATQLRPKPVVNIQDSQLRRDLRENISKTQGLDTPPISLRLPHEGSVDFSPWIGNHPEDVLSEHIVKHGFQTKAQISNETNTARPSLWNHLKNKSGMQSLSSLFVTVLEKRQSLGRLSSPSTFKPPPRVTLTDTKREGWLRELANPNVALRRLSRTIPYGITGKGLLEQCINKCIPSARAVWLAKCVGANEMRAFKRKGASGTTGAGGELKWIREWTSNVEQVVEGAISSCGQANWQSKMEYVIRLASHIYAENIIDRDHFLDWLLSSFEQTQPERLPVWLLISQIFWKDLVSARKRGRRLAECLLAHIGLTRSDPLFETHQDMLKKLQHLCVTLLLSHEGCFILPKTWKKYESTVMDLTSFVKSDILPLIISRITRRNNQLILTSSAESCIIAYSPSKQLIKFLDSFTHTSDIRALSKVCLALFPDFDQLVVQLLKWACSTHRVGDHRIYVAARLIRKWRTLEMDTDQAVLTFVVDATGEYDIDSNSVYRMFAEITRSGHFSVGRYLQWLIATGALVDVGDLSKSSKCHLRLLAEIPDHVLSPRTRRLRETLLRGVNFDISAERGTIARFQEEIPQHLPTVFHVPSKHSTEASRSFFSGLQSLGVNSRFGISQWLRMRIFDVMGGSKGSQEDQSTVSFTSTDFCRLRDILEIIGDFPILADIMKLAILSQDEAILTAISDALSNHHLTYAAVGALQELSSSLFLRYIHLRSHRLLDKPFLSSLLMLARVVDSDLNITAQLRYDLSRGDQKATIAVCSPASDNMTEVLHSSSISVDEEIESILSSGNSMDEHMIGRVFTKIADWIQVQDVKEDRNYGKLGTWLYRLRQFDGNKFDQLIHDWIFAMLLKGNWQITISLLPSLVMADCLTLKTFACSAKKALGLIQSSNSDLTVRIATNVLDALLPADDRMINFADDTYRYRNRQRVFISTQGGLIIDIFRLSVESFAASSGTDVSTSMRILGDDMRFRSFLTLLILQQPKVFLGLLESPTIRLSPVTMRYLKTTLDKIFDPLGSLGLPKLDLGAQMKIVLQCADDLALPFCLLQINHIFRIAGRSTEDRNNLIAIFLETTNERLGRNSTDCIDFVVGLEVEVAEQIRSYVEEQILNAIATQRLPSVFDSSNPTDSDTEISTFRGYLSMLDGTASLPTPRASNTIASRILDGFKAIAESLQGIGTVLNGETEQLKRAYIQICACIHALLRLTVIHYESFQNLKTGFSDSVAILPLLSGLLVNEKLQNHHTTVEFVFDVLSYLSDGLPDELRTLFSKSDTLRLNGDRRLFFLFGCSANRDDWLGLIHPSTVQSVPFNLPNVPRAVGGQQHGAVKVQQSPIPARVSSPAQRSTPTQQMLRSEMRTIPVPLRRWEILPDPTSNAGSNDTALSLLLFGARKG